MVDKSTLITTGILWLIIIIIVPTFSIFFASNYLNAQDMYMDKIDNLEFQLNTLKKENSKLKKTLKEPKVVASNEKLEIRTRGIQQKETPIFLEQKDIQAKVKSTLSESCIEDLKNAKWRLERAERSNNNIVFYQWSYDKLVKRCQEEENRYK